MTSYSGLPNGVFFTPAPASRKAGQEALGRMYSRTEDRDANTTWAVREAQYDAVCSWGIPDHAALQRLAAIGHRSSSPTATATR